MNVLALFVLLFAGALAGYLSRLNEKAIAFNRAATRYALGSLLFVMGTSLAHSRGLFARDLGLLASALGSSALLVAVLFLVFLALRPLLRLKGAERDAERAETHGGHELAAVAVNVGWIALGFTAFLLLPARIASQVPLEALADWVLRVLLAVIGFDLGADFHRLRLRDLPLPILLLPVADVLLSLACGALFALLKGMPLRHGLLLVAGMGWYSLSSVLIAQKGLVVMSLLAFIHNVARELLAILTAPVAARISPYLPIYIGGATSMDVMLPFIQKFSGRRYTLVAFYSGVVCSLAVIPLVRLLLGA
jgi:uncharacterized membrane protein YbjE (DUF340 family)